MQHLSNALRVFLVLVFISYLMYTNINKHQLYRGVQHKHSHMRNICTFNLDKSIVDNSPILQYAKFSVPMFDAA